MDCKRTKELILTDYIDGKLAGPELKELETHLASCDRCRALASETTSVAAALRQTKLREAPSEVWERIRLEVSASPARDERVYGVLEPLRFFFTHLRPAAAVATAVVLIFIVLTVARLMPQGSLLAPAGQDDILSLSLSGENGDEVGYNFGTQVENYFL